MKRHPFFKSLPEDMLKKKVSREGRGTEEGEGERERHRSVLPVLTLSRNRTSDL